MSKIINHNKRLDSLYIRYLIFYFIIEGADFGKKSYKSSIYSSSCFLLMIKTKEVCMKGKNKKTSYIVRGIMAVLILVSSVTINLWAKEPRDNLTEDEVLWHTSFDPTDGKTFLKNTVDDTKGDKNIKGFESIEKIVGEISTEVDKSSITGSNDYKPEEGKANIFDNSSGTKWLTGDSRPIFVQFSFTEGKTLDRYALVSANDASARDPKKWAFYGSNDGEWELIDQQENQTFDNRYETKEYRITDPKEYKNYKFEILENNGDGLTQFADLLLGTGVVNETNLPMVTMLSKGPGDAWNQKSNAGWDDEHALQVSGTHMGTKDAHSWNVLYKDVDVKITDKTALSYLIFPGLVNNEYDYHWTQMNMAVDLKFDDDTYLSDYNLSDTNGNLLTPQGQGDSRTLLTNQWNKIMARLGEHPNLRGKTVTQVLVAYDNKDNQSETNVAFQNYIDDIKLFNEATLEYDDNNLAEYVNILRGTNDTPNFSRGLTGPMVAVPHGFNFWAPVTNSGDNKLYTYQQNGSQGTLKHISVSHEPSYWVGDRGTWEYMVNTSIDPNGTTSIGATERAAKFSHDNETAKAHYYGVDFTEGNAKGSKLELSPTEHGSSTKFTFTEEADYHNVILDIVRGVNKKITLSDDKKSFTAEMRVNDSTNGSNGMKTMYVYGEFNTAWISQRYGNSAQNSAIVNFGDATEVEMKVTTSFISIDQAKHNMELELSGKSFAAIYDEARTIWNDKLDVITVEGATYEEKVTLYSNLYRTFIYPNLLSENTGTNENPVWKYKSTINEEIKEGTLYYNNGFWDTYHTTWAAYELLTPDKGVEMLNGLVEHYNDGGWVPRWVAPGGTNSMVGTSSDVIFADAAVNGMPFDLEKAYQSAIKNAAVVNVENLTSGGRAELNTSIFRGYTTNSTHEGFSWSMEGYINDYGISQMATILADQAEAKDNLEEAQRYRDEATYYQNRALNYVMLFDGSSEEVTDKWFKGKNDKGEWSQGDNFDPTFWGNDYTETDAYNMLVTVPQDGNGLANLYGGPEALAERMDTIFSTDGTYNGYNAVNGVGGIHEQREAREVKLGRYGHSNQPSHGILYMYNYAKQPWKTQQYVRDVLKRCYVGGTFGQGYIGDEDNGEMSAWYVLSSLGFFPVNMGSGEYAIGSPLFDKATIHLDNGQDLTIIANNNSDENVYIQSMTLNGENYNSSFINTKTLMEGGTVTFNMGSTPNKNWGVEAAGTSLTEGSDVANPLEDLTVPSIEVADTFDKNVLTDTVVGEGVENIKNLFDNNSNTPATFTPDTAIYYSYARPVKVSMMTLTSTKDQPTEAPKKFTLYGSSDGEEWVTLANQEDVVFEWGRYTRPFQVDNKDTAYQYYKLELKEGTTLSEIELFGQTDDFTSIDKTILSKLILHASSLDQTTMSDSVKQLLNDAIIAAQAVVDNEIATQEEVVKEYLSLQQIVVRIENIRPGLTRIEAETFDTAHSEIKNDGSNIGGVKKDTWVGYKDVEFAVAPTELEVRYSAQDSDACEKGKIEVRVDGRDGEPLFTIDTTKTGGWSKYTNVTVQVPSEVQEQFIGLHDLYFTFVGNDPVDQKAVYVANVDFFEFHAIYTQNVTIEGNGEIITTNFDIAYGETFTLEVQPDDGYKTIGVTIDGEALDGFIPGTNSFTWNTISKAHDIVITFAEDKEFAITKVEGIEADVVLTNTQGEEVQKAKVGETITVTVSNIPEDKKLDSVIVNGEEIALTSTRTTGHYTGTFIMPYSDVEVDVVFSDLPRHNVTVLPVTNGKMEMIGNVDNYIIEGKTLTIKAIPNADYKVSQLIINDVVVEGMIGVDKTVTYIIENVTEDITIKVIFIVDRNTKDLETLLTQANGVEALAKLHGLDTTKLEAAITAGQAVIEDVTKTQDKVDEASEAIRVELQRIRLQMEIVEAEDKDLSKYTEDSISAYQAIIKKAKDILEKADATKEELEKAIKDVKDAEKLLIEKNNGNNSVNPNPGEGTNTNPTGQVPGSSNNVKTGDFTMLQEYRVVILIVIVGMLWMIPKRKRSINK